MKTNFMVFAVTVLSMTYSLAGTTTRTADQTRAAIPLAASMDTVAFYPMTESAVGTVFKTLRQDGQLFGTNTLMRSAVVRSDVDAAKYLVWTRFYGPEYAEVSADVPGSYLFANATDSLPMSDSYRSLRFVDLKSGSTQPSAWIDGFGVELAKRAAWTLEFFVKDDGATPGLIASFNLTEAKDAANVKLQWPNAAKDSEAYLYSDFDGYSGSTNRSSVDVGMSLRDGAWHHVALVYSQPDESQHGTIRLFVDYKTGTGVCRVKRTPNCTPGTEFRIRGNIGGGSICAIRLTETALTADGFMRASDAAVRDTADRIAFYPLDDQPAGTVWTAGETAVRVENGYSNTVASAYQSAGDKLVLMATAAAGQTGQAFVATNDVPARYVYASVNADKPCRELTSALFMNDATKLSPTTDSGLANAYFETQKLAKDLAAVSTWTCEWFVKFARTEGKQILYDILYKDGDATNSKFALNVTSANVIELSNTSKTGGTWNPAARTSVAYPDIDSLADGKWHHLAIVCAGDKMRLYCDYALASDAIAVRRDAALAPGELRFGEGGVRATFSCLRVTAAALEPREFLYASDSADGVLERKTGWSWRLEGKRGSAVDSVSATETPIREDGLYSHANARGYTGAAVGDGTLTYAATPVGHTRIVSGEADGRNSTGVTGENAWLRSDVGAPLCEPGRIYTLETIVKAEQPQMAATVVGVESASGDTSWRLKVATEGALVLDVATSDGVLASKTILSEGFVGGAHHLAVAVDLLARTFDVFVDYARAGGFDATELTGLLVDGAHVVAGGGCGLASVAGVVDEIRLTRSLLDASAFVRFKDNGLCLVVR